MIPYLKDFNGKKVLMVGDKPFVMLSGEVHNSSSSSVEYMEAIWDKLCDLKCNSVLLPATWELIEPKEGEFHFELIDGLIDGARTHNMKIGFLWFGAWKNAQMMYAPEWVKSDLNRFKRAEVEKGKSFCRLKDFHGMGYTTLSAFCEETKLADAKAFKALMEHIKEVDEKENTVIMVQVENETGLQGAARENSEIADELFAKTVPQGLVDYLEKNIETLAVDIREEFEKGAKKGTWKEVFGEVADEIFQAYYVSSYVDFVANAGKEVYPLPMAANCWLDKGQKAGIFPSGGPVARVMEIWKYAAKNIDILAPDIYVPNFVEICDEYVKLQNPLFIPEAAGHGYAGSREVYVVGHYHAICYSPFGIEDLGGAKTDAMAYLMGVDVTDPMLASPQNVETYAFFNETLQGLTPEMGKAFGTNKLQATTKERPQENKMNFSKFGFMSIYDAPFKMPQDGVCLILEISENEFYVLGNGCMFMNYSLDPSKPNVDYLSIEDGYFKDGKWVMRRKLNGDEMFIRFNEPTLLKMKLLAYN